MRTRIELNKMRFYAYHGLYAEETEKGGWYEVNVSFVCDADHAIATDKIEGTVNYEEVYAAVKAAMEIPSHLLEHLAGRIIRGVKEKVKGVHALEVSIFKLEAPVGGPLAHVQVTMKDE